jgi:hypothetical protein
LQWRNDISVSSQFSVYDVVTKDSLSATGVFQPLELFVEINSPLASGSCFVVNITSTRRTGFYPIVRSSGYLDSTVTKVVSTFMCVQRLTHHCAAYARRKSGDFDRGHMLPGFSSVCHLLCSLDFI